MATGYVSGAVSGDSRRPTQVGLMSFLVVAASLSISFAEKKEKILGPGNMTFQKLHIHV